jgi:hypothetical protein
MNIKKLSTLLSVLLITANIAAEPKFSLSWENSFLTAKAVHKGEKEFKEYNLDDKMKGFQSLLVFRYEIERHFSLGLGSGINGSMALSGYSKFLEHNLYMNYKEISMFYIPIFVELRGQFPVRSDVLYIYSDAKIGGCAAPFKLEMTDDSDYRNFRTKDSFSGGFFLQPTLGVFLNREKFLFDIGIGYCFQKSELISSIRYNQSNYNEREETNRYPFNLNQFLVKFATGIKFGKK